MSTVTEEVTERRVYVFGGSYDQPELGANSRRLWNWIVENLSKSKVAQLRRAVLAAQKDLKDPERFIRWQLIVAVADELGVSGPGGVPINAALVRRLQTEDREGTIGRDAKITIKA